MIFLICLDYIPSSKISFDLNINELLAFVQQSILDINDKYYYIQYKFHNYEKIDKGNKIINPALFIFIIN